MNKILLSFCLLSQVFTSKAQTGIYKTYEDFVSRNIISMDTIVNFERGSLSSTKVIFLDLQGKKQIYKSKEMWGFIFEGHLFRSAGLDIAAVIDTGKVCYYESGIAHLRSIMAHVTSGHFTMGALIYLSKSLNSKEYDSFQKFCKENSEFDPLGDCLKNIKTQPKYSVSGNDVQRDFTEVFIEIRNCVAIFNAL